MRRIVVGVDEAGYGPNLGPLVVVASKWAIPANMTENGLVDALSKTFRSKRLKPDSSHVPLGDSKLLYNPASGIDSLEASVLAMLDTAGQLPPLPCGLDAFLKALGDDLQSHDPRSQNGLPPWYQNPPNASESQEADDLPALGVPGSEQQLQTVKGLSARAVGALEDLGIELLDAKVRLVREPEFNSQLDSLGSKGLLLSRATLGLVAETIGPTAAGENPSIEVFCDRQGGRKNYIPVLQDTWPESWFQPIAQESVRSSYREDAMNLKVHFTVKGDRFPPTALASMIAKYVRERSMQAFNQFWQSKIPGLRPTAGYPVDAQRFRGEIESTARTLNIDPQSWWRKK